MMKTLKILLPCLLVLFPSGHAQRGSFIQRKAENLLRASGSSIEKLESAPEILQKLANRLTSSVNNNQRHAFLDSFITQQEANRVVNLAGDKLFTNIIARHTFKVLPVAGSKFIGNAVSGKVLIEIFNPSENRARSYLFKLELNQIKRDHERNELWRITKLLPTPMVNHLERKRDSVFIGRPEDYEPEDEDEGIYVDDEDWPWPTTYEYFI